MLKNNYKFSALGSALLVIVLAGFTLSGCTTTTKTVSKSSPEVSQMEIQRILDELQAITTASKELQDTYGITETMYVNSIGQPQTEKGELSSTTAYVAETKTTVTRYPTNPSYREQSSGPRLIEIVQSEISGYKVGNPAPTEVDGVYTIQEPPEYQQVTIIYTKDGLLSAVKIQDTLVSPSSTNYYEANYYNTSNPIADQILKTNE